MISEQVSPFPSQRPYFSSLIGFSSFFRGFLTNSTLGHLRPLPPLFYSSRTARPHVLRALSFSSPSFLIDDLHLTHSFHALSRAGILPVQLMTQVPYPPTPAKASTVPLWRFSIQTVCRELPSCTWTLVWIIGSFFRPSCSSSIADPLLPVRDKRSTPSILQPSFLVMRFDPPSLQVQKCIFQPSPLPRYSLFLSSQVTVQRFSFLTTTMGQSDCASLCFFSSSEFFPVCLQQSLLFPPKESAIIVPFEHLFFFVVCFFSVGVHVCFLILISSRRASLVSCPSSLG